MASIIQRNKSFSVVYTIYDGDKKKQKWETYHSYEVALRRKEQLDLIQQHEKERAQYRAGTLAQFLEEYVELYGRIHWACSTYTSNEGLIRNYIVPFMGSMRLPEFSPKVIAALYGKMQSDPKIMPSVLTNIHKLLHSAFEQAVLWEYVPRNPFRKANVPKSFPTEIQMLTTDEIKILIQNCDNSMLSIAIHLAFAGSLRKGEILALTWDDVDFQKGTVSVSKTLKRVRRDAMDVLNGKDILYQFPAVFDEGRTVTVLKHPKTKSSIRTVYLPSYVLDVLQEWKETLKPVKRNQPDLILRYSNGRPLSEETLPRLLEKQLLTLADQGKTIVTAEELSEPFAEALCQHLLLEDRQGTSQKSAFLDACRQYNEQLISKDQLIKVTASKGFSNVLDAFHTVNGAEIPERFFHKNGNSNTKGITITDNVFKLRELVNNQNFDAEIEARWRLVETGWGLESGSVLPTL